jgi:hypothetical protein
MPKQQACDTICTIVFDHARIVGDPSVESASNHARGLAKSSRLKRKSTSIRAKQFEYC